MTYPVNDRAQLVEQRLANLRQLWQRYGRVMNLTSDLREASLTRHIAEAQLVVQLARRRHNFEGLRWLDVGSGGGFPGLVIMALAPEVEMTLVEPRAKRAAFLEIAIASLSATNSRLSRARFEGDRWTVLSGTSPGKDFDVATARAVFAPERWLEVGMQLVRQGGTVIVENPAKMRRAPAMSVSAGEWTASAFERDTLEAEPRA